MGSLSTGDRFVSLPDQSLEISVIDQFEKVVALYGDRPALDDGNFRLTYSELADLVHQIAGAVFDSTNGLDGPVGVLLAQETRFPAALLGVLRAGRAYVPLDADFPIKRNRLIAAQSGLVAMVSAGSLLTAATELVPLGTPVIDLDTLVTGLDGHLPPPPGPNDLSYIIYTSGSTGTPKGVFFAHRNAVFVAMDYVSCAEITPEDRVALLSSPSVAASVRCIYPALLIGASLHPLAPRRLGPAGLASAIRERRITVLNTVPRLLRHLIGALPDGERFDSVRWVHLAGDRVEWSNVDGFRRKFPEDASLMVAMASTEIGTAHSQWVVVGDRQMFGPRVPVGRDLPHRQVTLINEKGCLVSDGEPGEIVVTGKYLACGYWNEPELTSVSFQTDPADSSQRSFHTGDFARRRQDGLLEFLGRRDQQVKLRGHRVEIPEIETALRECEGVEDAAIVVRTGGSGEAVAIVAYVAPKTDKRPSAANILDELEEKLPQHMLPASVYVMDFLPLMGNYKIDREGLAKLDAERMTSARPEDSPLVGEILCVLERILGVSGATSQDTVYSLGGDSMQATMIAVELETKFSVSITPDIMNKTIIEIASWIAERNEQSRSAPCLHLAAELEEGFQDGDLPPRRKEDLNHWILACEALMERGKIEIVEHTIRRLHAEYPDLRYAATLISVFDNVVDGPAPFVDFSDNPNADVQVVTRPGSDAVLIAFCGAGHRLGLPVGLIHRWLGRLPASLVYLRDFRRLAGGMGYPTLGQDRITSIQALRSLIHQIGGQKIFTYGNSSGVFAALHYGLSLGANGILCMAGHTNLTPVFNAGILPMSRLAPRLWTHIPEYAIDLRQAYAEAEQPPQAILVYGTNFAKDRLHAENMAGLPSIELLPLEGCAQHNVIVEVLSRGLFPTLLQRLMEAGKR